VIEIHTASFRGIRGYTIITALLDEISYWPHDRRHAAVRVEPACVTKTAYQRHYGKDGDPQRVLKTHSSDEIAHLFADLRRPPSGRDFHRQ
jgi:hypothetical protein